MIPQPSKPEVFLQLPRVRSIEVKVTGGIMVTEAGEVLPLEHCLLSFNFAGLQITEWVRRPMGWTQPAAARLASPAAAKPPAVRFADAPRAERAVSAFASWCERNRLADLFSLGILLWGVVALLWWIVDAVASGAFARAVSR